MALADRVDLYQKLEQARNRPLIAYVTSTRIYAGGQIGADAVSEISRQLQTIPKGTQELDLLVISNGGDPTVAWRIVSLIRERVDKFSVLVPQAAFSAATMIALGADEIVMHPFGNLGPVDAQIRAFKSKEGAKHFGAEDLSALLEFAREEIIQKDEKHCAQMMDVFKVLCEEVNPFALGYTARISQLTRSMATKMLSLHMKDGGDGEKIEQIVTALHTRFFDHGYPISQGEAAEIGLKAVDPKPEVEEVLWAIWLAIEKDLALRTRFIPLELVKNNPDCAPLFERTQQVLLPQGLTPSQVQPFIDQCLNQAAMITVPATPFDFTDGLMESPRLASRSYERGRILAERQYDLDVKLTVLTESQGWEDVPIP